MPAGRGLAAGLLAGVAFGTTRLGAQRPAAGRCVPPDTAVTRRTPDAWPDAARAVTPFRGQRIAAVRVVALGPDRYGVLPAALHTTTRPETVRRLLLFVPGDTVDPSRVAQSMRQVRGLRYLAGASVHAACSETGGGVTITLTTRDQWSLLPRFGVGGPGGASDAVVGLEETNLLGTGRAARLYVRSDRGRVGAGASFGDPALLGSRLAGVLSRDVYRDGSAWGALVRTRDVGAFERWGLGVGVRQSALQAVVRGPAGIPVGTLGPAGAGAAQPGDTVRHTAAALLASRRVGGTTSAATFLVGGFEADRSVLTAGVRTRVVGPVAVRRTFIGADLGVARRSTRYVAVPWLVPSAHALGRENPAEFPLGVETDVVVGLGRDLATRLPTTHVDAWAGRMFSIGHRASDGTPRALASVDVWGNGYHPLAPVAGGGEWSAGTARAALGLVAPAHRGLWTARIAAERLADPDPDLRGLAMTDPVLRALPARTRFAEAALGATLERAVHVRPVTRGYVLDAALFGAASFRWDPAVSLSAATRAAALGGADPEYLAASTPGSPLALSSVGVGSVGLGLRLVPTAFGRATIRFDVGLPVLRTAGVPARPFFGITVTPAFGVHRGRDGGAVLSTP